MNQFIAVIKKGDNKRMLVNLSHVLNFTIAEDGCCRISWSKPEYKDTLTIHSFSTIIRKILETSIYSNTSTPNSSEEVYYPVEYREEEVVESEI